MAYYLHSHTFRAHLLISSMPIRAGLALEDFDRHLPASQLGCRHVARCSITQAAAQLQVCDLHQVFKRYCCCADASLRLV